VGTRGDNKKGAVSSLFVAGVKLFSRSWTRIRTLCEFASTRVRTRASVLHFAPPLRRSDFRASTCAYKHACVWIRLRARE